MVLLSAVNGAILLLSVHVRHVKVRDHVCLHYDYSSVANNIQNHYICQRCVHVSRPFTSAAAKS